MRIRSNHWINRLRDMVNGVQSCELDLTVPLETVSVLPIPICSILLSHSSVFASSSKILSSSSLEIIPCTLFLIYVIFIHVQAVEAIAPICTFYIADKLNPTKMATVLIYKLHRAYRLWIVVLAAAWIVWFKPIRNITVGLGTDKK